jgi:hypothetical protein
MAGHDSAKLPPGNTPKLEMPGKAYGASFVPELDTSFEHETKLETVKIANAPTAAKIACFVNFAIERPNRGKQKEAKLRLNMAASHCHREKRMLRPPPQEYVNYNSKYAPEKYNFIRKALYDEA